MNSLNRMSKVAFILVVVLFLAACATSGKQDAKNSLSNYAQGDYGQVATNCESDLGLLDPETGAQLVVEPIPDQVLLQLEAAEALRLSGEHERSLAHYDAVEILFRDEDTEGIATSASENFVAVIWNDTAKSYEPTPVERVLANYYKATSYWTMGNKDGARVEFNRASDRAQRALERYQSEFKEAQAAADTDGAKAMASHDATMNRHFPDAQDWSVYSDFQNPAVLYVNALFYQAEGENARARDTMRQVRVKTGKNTVVDSDFLSLDQNRSLTAGGNFVWVLFEAGRSSYLIEKRADLPIPTGSSVILVSIALPTVESRHQEISVGNTTFNGDSVDFVVLADSEKLIKTELSMRYPGILTRSVISATVKGAAQAAAAEQNAWLGLGVTLLSAQSTKADTRMWGMIPNQWLLAKIAVSSGGVLQMPWGEGQVEEIVVPDGESSLILVKQPTMAAQPSYSIVKI